MWDFEKIVDNINNVPAEYRGLYVEGDDGNFVIADSAKGLVSAYIGMNKSSTKDAKKIKDLNSENAERRVSNNAYRTLAEEMGIDVEDDDVLNAFKATINQLRDGAKDGAQLKVDLDKVNADWKRRYDEGIAGKDQEILGKDRSISMYLIDQKATSALAENKGSVDLLMPHIQKQCQVVVDGENIDGSRNYVTRVVDTEGNHRTDGKGGFMTVENLVTEMKTQDSFARAFESETPSGGGKQPGSGGNPNMSRDRSEMSSTQKIATGLSKGQHSN